MFLFSQYVLLEQGIPPENQPPQQQVQQAPPAAVQQQQQEDPQNQPVAELPADSNDISLNPQIIELKRYNIITKLERLQSNLASKNIIIDELNTIIEYISFFDYDILIKLMPSILEIVRHNISKPI